MIKNNNIFFNMCYGVYYYVIKFQLKTPPMHGEMKKDKLQQGDNLGCYPDFGYS